MNAAPDRVELNIGGMSCAACAARVQRALSKVPGVELAEVNFADKSATVRLAGAVPGDQLVAAVRAIGFEADPRPSASDPRPVVASGLRLDDDAAAAAKLRIELIVGTVLTVPLVLIAMSHGRLAEAIGASHHALNWTQLVLAAPVVAWIGRRFFASAWRAARHGHANMDTLVALGASASFLYSLVALLAPASLAGDAAANAAHVPLYFEAAATIVLLVSVGKLLEARATSRTGEAVRRLASLQPRTARVRIGDGEQERPIEAIRTGDVVMIRPGERVPVDGTIIEGRGAVDESLVTGESVPVEKTPGAVALTGTINATGWFAMVVTNAGNQTTLARIIELVRQAQSSRPQVARLADRISGVFVPVVLGIAAATFFAWWLLAPGDLPRALNAAVSVVVIACPCALGLATPTAVMVGVGRGAERGVLVRTGRALEVARDIRIAAFDKTGTLTEGRPALVEVIPATGVDPDHLLMMAAAAERGSEHPIAGAVLRAAADRGLVPGQPRDFTMVPGGGVQATVETPADRRTVLVGTSEYLIRRGVAISLEQPASEHASLGRTPVFVAIDGREAGVLIVADRLRPETPEAIHRLRNMGIDSAMLTGDRPATAAAIAAEAGISRVHAALRPEDKADAIAALRVESGGGAVAMIGDGVNDAPALAAASVGIAMGSGTDIAAAAADIVLMRPDVRLVAEAIELSRLTMSTIRRNLGWAFAYNVLAIPLAAAGLLSPMIASAAMALSSISVVLSSLMLRRTR